MNEYQRGILTFSIHLKEIRNNKIISYCEVIRREMKNNNKNNNNKSRPYLSIIIK